jgi:DNA-directed RNA polymerase specialized sigma24 family protein
VNTTATATGPRVEIFATTRWTVVLAAGRRDEPQAAAALEELCRTYWYPLYVFARGRGLSKEDAEDSTQELFRRLLSRNDFDGLTAERGRFRAFLLAAMKHFLANEWDRSRALKRGGDNPLLPLDWHQADARYGLDLAAEAGPDTLFDRAWAVTLLERVIGRLRAETEGEGKAALFEAAKPFLTVGGASIPYAQAAATLDMSEVAVRVAIHRLRQRYRELLRDEIRQTLADPGQTESEIQSLFSAFA